MRSKASYFSVSRMLILENFRRFWPLPVLMFIAYFLTGFFPLMIRASYYGGRIAEGYYFYSLISNSNFFFCAISLMTPIAVAIGLYRYAQQTAAVTRIHSLPLTRTRIFCSHYLSGLLMLWIPMLATGALLAVVADRGSYGELAMWIWTNLIILAFNYGICALAAVIAGTTVHQILLTFFLLFALPLSYLISCYYCDEYLWGFSGVSGEIVRFMSAWIYPIVSSANGYSAVISVYFILLSALIFAAGLLFYKERKPEKTGDGLVYGFMFPIVSFFGAFWGMSFLGWYFSAVIEDSFAVKCAGYVLGALLGLVIARMVLFKTPKIFNGRLLRVGGIYALSALAFFGILRFDLLGYSARVPADPDGAKLSVSYYYGASGSGDRYYSSSAFGDGTGFSFVQKENIEQVKKAHKELAALGKELNGARSYDGSVGNVHISYMADSGLTGEGEMLSRSYNAIPEDFLRENEALKALYESDEYKDYFSLKNMNGGVGVKTVQIDRVTGGKTVFLSGSDAESFAEACDRDFREFRYENMFRPYNVIAYAEFESYEGTGRNEDEKHKSFYADLCTYDSHALEWLEEHGYADMTGISAEEVKSATVTHYYYAGEDFESSTRGEGEWTSDEITVSDRDTIEKLLEYGRDRYYSWDDYYNLQFELQDGYVYEFAIEAESAPDVLKELF